MPQIFTNTIAGSPKPSLSYSSSEVVLCELSLSKMSHIYDLTFNIERVFWVGLVGGGEG
jgi:hypothetical protein